MHARDANAHDDVGSALERRFGREAVGGSPRADSFGSIAGAWADAAEALADWTWRTLLNRTDAWGRYRAPGRPPITQKGVLASEILRTHFVGRNVSDLVGLHTTSPGGTCRWIALDLDQHDVRNDAVADAHRDAMQRWSEFLCAAGAPMLALDSNGRGGYHLVLPLAMPIPLSEAFELVQALVSPWRMFGAPQRPETFPKQGRMTEGGYGNWLRLPGRHHSHDHWTRVWDGAAWVAGRDATSTLLATTGVDVDVARSAIARLAEGASAMKFPDGAAACDSPANMRRDDLVAVPPRSGDGLRAGEGRNNAAYRMAAELYWDAGCDRDLVAAELAEWNSRNLDPLDDAELARTIDNAIRYGRGREDAPAIEPVGGDAVPASAALDDVVAGLARTHAGAPIGLRTGSIPALDDALMGMRGLMVLAAEPGIGKTTLGIQCGLDVLAQHDDACFVFFSFEMSRAEVIRRMLCRLSRLSWRQIVEGDPDADADERGLRIAPARHAALDAACAQLRALGERVRVVGAEDGRARPESWFVEHVESAKASTGVRRAFVLVDNLQSMPIRAPQDGFAGLEFDRRAIGMLMRLQHRAPDDDVVLVISEQTKQKMGGAELGSALGSARIVYSADVVMFLVGATEAGASTDEPESPLDLVIRKGRDGMRRTRIRLRFLHQHLRFEPDDDRDWDVGTAGGEGVPLAKLPPDARHGVRWTPVEEEFLRFAVAQGLGDAEIGQLLKRTAFAIHKAKERVLGF